MHNDRCPICGTATTHLGYSAPDSMETQEELDLGWGTVTVTRWRAPKITHWMLDPCGCVLPTTDWVYHCMPDEPIRWMHPDELERFLSDKR